MYSISAYVDMKVNLYNMLTLTYFKCCLGWLEEAGGSCASDGGRVGFWLCHSMTM